MFSGILHKSSLGYVCRSDNKVGGLTTDLGDKDDVDANDGWRDGRNEAEKRERRRKRRRIWRAPAILKWTRSGGGA